jgi:uncharacterized membrane protein
MRNKVLLTLLFVAQLFLCGSALAGGPLFINPTTKKAYHYGHMPVPVYYDRGPLAVIWDYSQGSPVQIRLTNAVGKHLVEKGFHDWSNVPTASFRAHVAGNFSTVGLPNITGANVQDVIGNYNGGGIYVIFDADGSIMENFFGVSPEGILGISSPEWAQDGTEIDAGQTGDSATIVESWTVLNGQAINPQDPNAEVYQGIATHEFGHAIGLAHTQTNGAAYFYSMYGENVGPASCSTLPYSTNLTVDDVETMYPFADPNPGGSGKAQANIHTLDDISAISDLYPGPGWPDAYGTIKGRVLDVDGKTELTGVNVVARNLSNPYAGATSALSGEWTQGMFGADGSFTLHGLIPGASYVLYVDAVLAGGFPTPPMWFLPGAERFYDGSLKGSKHEFDPCQYKVLQPSSHSITAANVRFERVAGAPILFNLGYGPGPTDISGDGTTVVGNWGRGGPPFTWTEKAGIVNMNVATTGEFTNISKNGRFISTNLFDPNTGNGLGAYRWDKAHGWLRVAPVGTCGTDTTTNYGVANDGTVWGMSYNSCTDYKGFHWNPQTGTVLLRSATTQPDGSPANGHPLRISADGSVAVGWEETPTGARVGVIWANGAPKAELDENGNSLGEIFATSSDGSVIGGGPFPSLESNNMGWRKNLRSGAFAYLKSWSDDASPAQPFAISRSGKVMAGFAGDPWFSFAPGPFLWTKQMGVANLNDFLRQQGTSIEQYMSLWQPMAISDDGTVLTGWGFGFQYYAGWVVKMPKVFVCHAEADEHGESETLNVAFPQSFDQHLAHGDTVGRCPDRKQ